MAPPLAADNFGQRQAITTAIRNICQYYPPNTCLRELLQNADDAGASEIEYVLDTKSYSGEPLLSQGLKEFQGPALLARNNSTFRDEDFKSLSSIGDSVKVRDPASTGKFGQGFNAVYHWTDGPWIYSRNWLLLLDPHEWWSHETGQGGGPRWDVIKHRDSAEVQNHLETFNTFNLARHQPLDQTVIRIPLRTSAQAAQSKLFQTKIEIREIRQALKEFGEEIKEGGLLFLKHVRKIIIRVNGEVMLDSEILGTNEDAVKEREQLPRDFKSLYASRPSQSTKDHSPVLELAIRYTEGKTSRVCRYIVQHVMLPSSGNTDMDTWAREYKLFPWAAVAAPLKDDYGFEPTKGRIFTTLRLPMPTNLPIHIHGLFSIAPDRGRLSFTRGPEDLPTRWNNFMFATCVTLAWLKLLAHRNGVSWQGELFAFWPRANLAPVEMWDKLDDNVIDKAIKMKSKVWNTCDGRCVDFGNALFAIENAEATTYKSALAEVHVPAVYLEESLFLKAKQRAEFLSEDFQSLALSKKDLVTRYILPWIDRTPTTGNGHLSLVKELLVDWMMKKSLPYSKAWAVDVFSYPIIPLPIHNGQRDYRCISGMVDPISDLAKLYDAEERLFPCSDFSNRHRDALLAYGLLSKPVWSTPLERARYLSQRGGGIDVRKVERLLKLPVLNELASSQTSVAEIRRLKWLPGTSATGRPVLLAPQESRGAEEACLVDMVLGTTTLHVKSDKWKKVLGWDQPVSSDVLLKQLDACLLKKDYRKADNVLLRLQPEDSSALTTRSWILGRSGDRYQPAKVFLPGSELQQRPLSPYLDEVDAHFSRHHKRLLEALSISPQPSVKDLQDVEHALAETSQGQLDPSGIRIVKSVLEIATRLKYDSTDLLVPDTSSKLRRLADIVHGEPLEVGDKSGFHFTHPEISPNLIHQLSIEDSQERAIRLDIELESDEDYTPCERFETTISDTLERYSIADTFNEFLANADDAGASKIVWIVDENSHAASSLLTTELRPFQGPSLMVYNDAVFSKEDFNGFKDIGQGGKKGDVESTGMFGRGAQCLYHFTDLPELLSNDSFLVLDPQQQVLPIDPKMRRKRRVGVKMPFTTVNRLAHDQMAPFVGLYSFDPNQAKFDGTIFRFPLRAIGAKTSLKETQQTVDSAHVKYLLREYFATARTALLFLRHVTSIEFQIRAQESPEWTVSAKRIQCTDHNAFQRIEITTTQTGSEQQKDIWCVGLKAITKIPSDIKRSGRGSGKSTECGIATCLREGRISKYKNEGSTPLLGQPSGALVNPAQPPPIEQKVYCRLPTIHKSSLPVSFHASFAVTRDRRNIPLEVSAENSEWNLWLLNDAIPAFYLKAMQYLASRLGHGAFRFWPAVSPSTTLSGILGKAFWEHLSNINDQAEAILPIVAQDVRPEKQDGATVLESSQKITNVLAARFDFLSESTSKSLQRILVQTTPLLVRPPERLWPSFKRLGLNSKVEQVDVDYLGQVFKVEENCKFLDLFVADLKSKGKRATVLASLLKTMIPDTRRDNKDCLSVLDKCRIIPRPGLDHPLGTLIWKPDIGEEWHLVPTPEEEELFSFASQSMVHTGLFPRRTEISDFGTGVHHDPINTILNAHCNVRRLKLGDMGSLLSRLNSPIASWTNAQDRDSWMLRFWQYLNPILRATYDSNDHSAPFFDETVDTLLSKANLRDQPIYRTHSNQQWSYITPREFETKPYVVQPADRHHRSICALIPGLAIVDPECAPFLLRDQETSLDKAGSFKRLLRAIEKLEKKKNTGAKAFIGYALKPESKDIMKDLALNYLKSGNYDRHSSDSVLRRLPIWRRLKLSPSPPHEHIAAEDAFFSNFGKMLMPWVKKLSTFVETDLVDFHRADLSKLDVSPLAHEQIWDIIKSDIPSEVKSDGSRQQYLEFIQYLAQWKFKISGKVAPNGASVMCEVTTLYDHQDKIFLAAFREQQSTRFLHKDMRMSGLRGFWLSLGLRARSDRVMRREHFLECALAINRRWNPSFTTPDYVGDSRTVASYLKFDGDEFRSWPEATWGRLASIPMFRVWEVPDDELVYRRDRMLYVAQQKTHRALEDTAHIDHKRIIWSHTTFLREQPGNFAYATLPRSGKPTAANVFDHLSFLVAMAKNIGPGETSEYLRDIQACYGHLQENLATAINIPGIYKASIWFNLNITQVELASKDLLEASLTSANLLCLNSPVDPLPIRVARKFLIPYEKLLMGLGCKTVMQPTSASQPQSSDSRELSLAAAMAEMRQLRDQGLLVDVYFEAEGEKKPAHKVVLAAVSEYCKAQFAGHWGRLLQDQATVHIEDLRFLTLSQMTDFAYTGDFEWPELRDDTNNEEIAKNLEMLLDLLDGTDRWLLQRLHHMTDNFLTSEPYSAIYVRVDTVEWIKERAEGARALRLVKYCEDFFARNEEFVVALREDQMVEVD